MQYIDFYASPLGKMTIASNGQKLTGLWFDKQKYFGAGLAVDAQQQNLPIFAKTKNGLIFTSAAGSRILRRRLN